MKSFAKILVAGAVAASVSLSAMAGSHSKITVGYITKSATNAGWIMINNGAADAAKEVGAKLITVGPAFQGDLSSQLEVFENLTAQGVNAIALAPVDSKGVAPAVKAAMDRGIPVVAVDTGVSGADVTSFVATDNFAVATIQGQEAAKLVNDGDKIIYVTGNQAQQTGQERRDGFLKGFKATRGNAQILEVPTKWDDPSALAGCEALLNKHNDVKMIVSAWDGGTMNCKAALENLGYAPGDVKMVGFDGATDAILAMDEGWVHANTAQMLYKMGYEGVKTAVAAAKGETVSKRIDTGTFLVTPKTSAEYKKLIGM
jgi:ABC-type sugar transport system substrate-binding protein